MDEHRVIEQVLACLEEMANRCEAEEKLEGKSAVQALVFFRHFADRCHHGKEEDHLFPLLEARGLPRAGGPTGVMVHEHEQGRLLVAAMTAAVEKDTPREFARYARAYARHLREHIRKEDQVLFPLAARVLSEPEAEALLRSFEHVESDVMGKGTHEQYLRLANDLAERFGVPRARVALSSGHGCCHHHR